MTIQKKIKDIFKQFLIILLYIFMITGLQILFYNSITSSNQVIMNLSNILIYLIVLTVFLIIFRKNIIPDFDDFKKNGQKYLNDKVYLYLIGLVIMLVSNLIISKFIGLPQNEEANRELLKSLPIYSILSTVIFAPIIEEAMTRIILKDTFKHSIIYIFLSGFIFGLLHVIFSDNIWELFYIISYGSLGFAFAKMYYDTNNIWCSIFFHSMHNFISVMLLLIGVV